MASAALEPFAGTVSAASQSAELQFRKVASARVGGCHCTLGGEASNIGVSFDVCESLGSRLQESRGVVLCRVLRLRPLWPILASMRI